MQQRIKNWLQDNALFIALGVSFLIALLSLMNTKHIPDTGLGISDKFLHIFAYVVLMWSWLLVQRNNNSLKKRLVLFICLMVFGIILEILQGTVITNRTTDWKDVVANISGLILGLISFGYLFRLLFNKING